MNWNCENKGRETEVTLRGKGGHSSRPEEADNPLIAGLGLIRLLREKYGEYGLVPVSFEAGTAPNAIPDTGKLIISETEGTGLGKEFLKESLQAGCSGLFFRDISGEAGGCSIFGTQDPSAEPGADVEPKPNIEPGADAGQKPDALQGLNVTQSPNAVQNPVNSTGYAETEEETGKTENRPDSACAGAMQVCGMQADEPEDSGALFRKRVSALVEENTAFLIEARRHFHRYPELSGHETETAAWIRGHLDAWGTPWQTAGNNSTVAVIHGLKAPGTGAPPTGGGPDTDTPAQRGIEAELPAARARVLALRGDIDALPIAEETGVPYASANPGIMHACGHDCHAAWMLGAAKLLNELREHFSGTVKVIFQEEEETGFGALRLMESGLLADVDRIAGLHVTQEYDLGTFALGYGVRTAFGAGEEVTVETGAGENALELLSAMHGELYRAARDAFRGKATTVLVPTMVKTLERNGLIPSAASLYYDFRSHDPEGFSLLHGIFERIPQAGALAFHGRARVRHLGYDEAVINDRVATDLAVRLLEERFGAGSIIHTPARMSGEDFAIYNRKIPGVFIHVGGAVNGEYRMLHTAHMLPDDGVLAEGLAFLLDYACAFLNE